MEKTYGVRVNFDTYEIRRINKSVGLSPGADFNEFNAMGGRKKCMVTSTGEVLAYYGDPGYTESGFLERAIQADKKVYPVGAFVQIMVEQPLFHYRVIPRRVGQDKILYEADYIVSDTPFEDSKIHPAFIKNGKVCEKIYLASYESITRSNATGLLNENDAQNIFFEKDAITSCVGGLPTSGDNTPFTRANIEKMLAEKGTGWSQYLLTVHSMNQLLFLVEFASINAQTNIGRGCVDKVYSGINAANRTGETVTLGNQTGSGEGVSGFTSVTYRGMENLWGNLWTIVQGINVIPTVGGTLQAYIASDNFVEEKADEQYRKLSFNLPSTKGTISRYGYDRFFDWAFIPIEVLGHTDTDYFDRNPNYPTKPPVYLAGGDFGSKDKAGMFAVSCYYQIDEARENIGARLVYHPIQERGMEPRVWTSIEHTDIATIGVNGRYVTTDDAPNSPFEPVGEKVYVRTWNTSPSEKHIIATRKNPNRVEKPYAEHRAMQAHETFYIDQKGEKHIIYMAFDDGVAEKVKGNEMTLGESIGIFDNNQKIMGILKRTDKIKFEVNRSIYVPFANKSYKIDHIGSLSNKKMLYFSLVEAENDFILDTSEPNVEPNDVLIDSTIIGPDKVELREQVSYYVLNRQIFNVRIIGESLTLIENDGDMITVVGQQPGTSIIEIVASPGITMQKEVEVFYG